MSKGKSNLLVYIIGGVLVVGLGVGGYMLWKKAKEKKAPQGDGGEDSVSESTEQGTASSSTSSQSSSSNPFKSKEGVKRFQQWVRDTKKDSAILGRGGADGIWGNNTANAYAKYGEEYNILQRGGGGSTSSIPQPTENDYKALQDSMKPELQKYPLRMEGNIFVKYRFKQLYDNVGKPIETITATFSKNGSIELNRSVSKGGGTEDIKFSGRWYYSGKRLVLEIDGVGKVDGTYTPDVVLKAINKSFKFNSFMNMEGAKPYVDAQDAIL